MIFQYKLFLRCRNTRYTNVPIDKMETEKHLEENRV